MAQGYEKRKKVGTERVKRNIQGMKGNKTEAKT